MRAMTGNGQTDTGTGRPARVALLAAGGTIACTLDDDGYAVKTRDAADLAVSFPAPEGVEVVPFDYGRLSSWSIEGAAMLDIARRVDALLADHDGVVLTHGTDTLEETATFLSFAVRSSRAVAVTGAMRTVSEPGYDGSRNLFAATLVAAEPAAAGRGALVVFNDTVDRAVEVTKRHSTNPATFGVPWGGPVGWVDGTTVGFRCEPGQRRTYEVRTADARVPLVVAAAGMDAAVVERAVADCDGLVVAGFGVGHVPASWVPAVAAAVDRGVPVVMTTRTGAGPVAPMYRGPGGSVDMAERGVVPAGYRTPYAARIELVCALGAGLDTDEIRTAFAGRP
jgi:L-asparaginase